MSQGSEPRPVLQLCHSTLCHLPQLKGTAAPPPAQGASSLSGHPSATRKNHFWGLSELLQCPCAKSVLPSSRFSAWRDQHSPADRGGKGSVHSIFLFCVLPLAPGLSSPSPRRGAHHLSDCHVYSVVISSSPLSKEDLFVVPCSEGTTIKPSLLFREGMGHDF